MILVRDFALVACCHFTGSIFGGITIGCKGISYGDFLYKKHADYHQKIYLCVKENGLLQPTRD